jgi:protein-disulfide isomerase
MGSVCNSGLTKDQHPRACELAHIAGAAHRQGRFWQLHDAVFQSKENGETLDVDRLVRDAGVDTARLKADVQSEAVTAAVKADIDLGLRLGVNETPAVFVGGRRAPDVRTQTIQFLIIAELANRSVIKIAASTADRPEPAIEIDRKAVVQRP